MTDGPVRLEIKISGGYQIVFGKQKLKALMRKAGNEVAAVTRSMLRRQAGGGRVYHGSGGGSFRGGYRGGSYTASAPGESPVSITGTLARSIKVKPFKSGEGVSVRETAFYALFLAKGAKGKGRRILLARPSLTEALAQRQASLEMRIRAAVVDDIEFKRVKP